VLWVLFSCLPCVAAIAGDAVLQCVQCHSTRHVAAFTAGECAGCHGADVTAQHASAAPRLLAASMTVSGKTRADEMPAAVAPAGSEPAAFLPGMSLPLYYEHSRVGTQPNEMVYIPAGEFTMGTDDRLPDEGPAHMVNLAAYYIDKYEVTNGQYKAFIDATGHKSPSHFENRTYPDGKVDHPVTEVTWYDARDYCTWAGKRLPTDAEWEKAARGTDARSYPWGNVFGVNRANTPQFWVALDREGDTSPVGAFEDGKSAYGLYDMSGNVWEWTDSWYRAYPGNQHPTENYGETYKTLKGGSWWDCTFYKCGISAPSFNRSFFLRTTRNPSFGFRCAKDAS